MITSSEKSFLLTLLEDDMKLLVISHQKLLIAAKKLSNVDNALLDEEMENFKVMNTDGFTVNVLKRIRVNENYPNILKALEAIALAIPDNYQFIHVDVD